MCHRFVPLMLQCFLLCSLYLPTSAMAGIIAADDFSYPNGVLDQTGSGNGGTGWIDHWVTSFSTFGGIEVSSGVAQGAPLGNDPKYATRTFNNPGSTNQLYVSFDFITPSVINTADYFGMAMTLGVNNNLLSFGKNAGSNKLWVGNGGSSSTLFDILPNTTYRLIGAYDIRHVPNGDPDRLSLWVNPDASDFYNVVTGASSADVSRNDMVAFHAATATFYTNTVAAYQLDNLVISNMAEGVGLNQTMAVPEPTSFALAAIGLVGLAAAVCRRRSSRGIPCESAV